MAGNSASTTQGVTSAQHIFTCFNCREVRDSLWIVSHLVDLGVVDECLCCAECLCRNLAKPAFARERRISLRCGGDGCQLQLDTWTKGSELIVSLIKDHTVSCPFRPIFCPYGCLTVFRRQDLSTHEETCELSTRRYERELKMMEEVEKRLIVPPSQMRYYYKQQQQQQQQKQSPPPVAGNVPLAVAAAGNATNGGGGGSNRTSETSSWKKASTSTPQVGAATTRTADHETLRREAMIVSRRSSVVPVPERSESNGGGNAAVDSASRGSYYHRASRDGDSLRKEALAVSRRSSLAAAATAPGRTQPDGVDMSLRSPPKGSNNNSSNVNTDGADITPLSPQQRSNGIGCSVSDETLEQLEKARLALERECIEVPDGVSYLPDVVAQRLRADDLDLRDRVEKLEELVATTRAQLEKAFAENRNLRALLSSEHKLRELHVTRLRDEVEILRSVVYPYLRQRSGNVPQQNGNGGGSDEGTVGKSRELLLD